MTLLPSPGTREILIIYCINVPQEPLIAKNLNWLSPEQISIHLKVFDSSHVRSIAESIKHQSIYHYVSYISKYSWLKELILYRINISRTHMSAQDSLDICLSKYPAWVPLLIVRLFIGRGGSRQPVSTAYMHHFRTFDLKTKSTVAWGARSRKLARGLWQRDATESRSKFKDTRPTSGAKIPHKVSACTWNSMRRSLSKACYRFFCRRKYRGIYKVIFKPKIN